jgi:hypothetical protein
MNDTFPNGFLKLFSEYGGLAVVLARKNIFRQLADSVLKRHLGEGENRSEGTIN